MNFIHPTAVIGPNVILGDNNYIGPLCIIGYPAEHKDFFFVNTIEEQKDIPSGFNPTGDTVVKREPNYGRVVIGNNNTFTGLVTIDAGTEGDTIIGNKNWFLKHSHVGHDAEIGSKTIVSCGAKIGGHCKIGDDVNIGLNAVIHQRQRIADGCMIGMQAAVTKVLVTQPQRKYAGVPAKDIGGNPK